MSIQLIRENLLNFACHMVPQYKINWHHRVVARHLHAIESGEITRLIITMPPRHGKSMLASELFPAWFMGRNPADNVIFTTYGQNLADRFGRKVRNTIDSADFRKIFPECVLSDDSKSKRQFATTAGGEYSATGRGGPITGKGGRLIISDDLIKDDSEAASKIVQQSTIDWLESTLITRFEPDARWVIQATRWNENDPIGWALDKLSHDGWVVLDFPALIEPGYDMPEYDPRKEGEALWEERYSREKLLKIKSGMTPYFWNAMFQQKPSPPEGNMIKRQWFKFYKELPPKFDLMISSWDLTFKAGEGSAYVVGQVWGRLGAFAYLVYQYRQRMDFMKTIEAFLLVHALYPMARRKIVERAANAEALMSALEKRVPGIDLQTPKGSKELRAIAVSPFMASGNVLLPDPSIQPWVLDFVEECAVFPNGTFKDQVDAMTQALDNLFNAEASQVDRIRKLLTM